MTLLLVRLLLFLPLLPWLVPLIACVAFRGSGGDGLGLGLQGQKAGHKRIMSTAMSQKSSHIAMTKKADCAVHTV